ncbi:MAG: hypothetical protein ACE5D6_09385 [Candidatus Zixiibacteriota bacterium]
MLPQISQPIELLINGTENINISAYIYNYFDVNQLKLLPSSITLFDHTTQNKLVNYIFKHQIEMRKKGLL